MPTDPNQAASDLTLYLQRTLPCLVLPKGGDKLMDLVSLGLQALNIIPADQFMHGTSTTVPPVIWLEDSLRGLDRIAALAHEGQHCDQGYRHPDRYVWLGITSGEYRAGELESEAYAAQLEVEWALYGRIRDPGYLDQVPHIYGLNTAEQRFMRVALEQRVTAIAAGLVGTRVGKLVIDWLKTNAPDLLFAAPSAPSAR